MDVRLTSGMDSQAGISCSGCSFWDREANTEEGYCHRYAPRPAEKGSPTRWQLTMATDWCGDFQETTT